MTSGMRSTQKTSNARRKKVASLTMMGDDNDGGVDGFDGGDGGGGGASGSAGDVVVLKSCCWRALIAEKGEDVVMEEVASCLARWAGAGDQLGAGPPRR